MDPTGLSDSDYWVTFAKLFLAFVLVGILLIEAGVIETAADKRAACAAGDIEACDRMGIASPAEAEHNGEHK